MFLDGAVEIYHILIFSVVIFILTLRSLKETFSDILVKMSVPISFLNLGYYRVGKVFLDLKYVNKIFSYELRYFLQ